MELLTQHSQDTSPSNHETLQLEELSPEDIAKYVASYHQLHSLLSKVVETHSAQLDSSKQAANIGRVPIVIQDRQFILREYKSELHIEESQGGAMLIIRSTPQSKSIIITPSDTSPNSSIISITITFSMTNTNTIKATVKPLVQKTIKQSESLISPKELLDQSIAYWITMMNQYLNTK